MVLIHFYLSSDLNITRKEKYFLSKSRRFCFEICMEKLSFYMINVQKELQIHPVCLSARITALFLHQNYHFPSSLILQLFFHDKTYHGPSTPSPQFPETHILFNINITRMLPKRRLLPMGGREVECMQPYPCYVITDRLFTLDT